MILPTQFFNAQLLSEVLLNVAPWLKNNARLSNEGDVLIAISEGIIHFTHDEETAVFRAPSVREAELAVTAIVAVHRSHGVTLNVEHYYY